MPDRYQSQELTEQDHQHMDDFLKGILQDHRNGDLTQDAAVGALAHVMTALAIGNTGEAQTWFRSGRKLARDGGLPPLSDDDANYTYINDVRVKLD